MFGNYSRIIDEKNRVIIPSKLRENLGNFCYVTVGPEKILELRDEVSFNKFREKLLSQNMLNPNIRQFVRILLGNTFELEIDKANRITFSEEFIKKTSITKELTFVGVGDKIEIWSKKAFDEFQSKFNEENSIDDLAMRLLKEGVDL